MVFAAIDTGSNAIRMALSKCLLGQLPEDIEVIRVPVRLGKDVFAHGYVKEKTAKELFSAFQQFRRIMDKQGVEHYRAVATSALREAQNGKELAQEIHRLTNINLEIIDGLAEAELVLLAISDYFKIAQLDALILDIGGGSVEAIICWQGKVQSLESLRMGTVRLLKDFDPDHELDSMLSRVRQNVRRFHHKLSLQRNQHSERLIVTGGNARCLGRLAVQFLGSRSPSKMSYSELESLLTLLHSLSTKLRREELGLKADRADVIVPAALIIYEFMDCFGYTSFEIPPVGLKNGVLRSIEKTFTN